jgi:hypothetical protein
LQPAEAQARDLAIALQGEEFEVAERVWLHGDHATSSAMRIGFTGFLTFNRAV